MHDMVKEILEKLELGQPQEHENLQIFPIFYSDNHSPEYLTMKEALEKKLLVVTEVGKEGSVPELMVKNESDSLVLLLDGEELMGAKQNRVLNTSILLKTRSETTIPVSCTEQGRWAYISPVFMDSNVVVHSKLRAAKLSSVSASLKFGRRFSSDQGRIWNEVADLAQEAQVNSPTGAMKDVYKNREKELSDYLNKFPPVEGQKGVLILINGKVIGMDYISYSPAFNNLHPKLIKSYALDAVLSKKTNGKHDARKLAGDFLTKAKECAEKKYQSVGLGWDHRFEGKELVGSALVHEDKVIHLAFFTIEENEKIGNISSSSQRKGYRIL
jgi:hypothetical protein